MIVPRTQNITFRFLKSFDVRGFGVESSHCSVLHSKPFLWQAADHALLAAVLVALCSPKQTLNSEKERNLTRTF